MYLSEVILDPVVTEKASFLKEKEVYAIKVSPRSNKILVKQAVEKKFLVKVTSVKIINQKAKVKQSASKQGKSGKKSSFKKAYVRIEKGSKINDLEL